MRNLARFKGELGRIDELKVEIAGWEQGDRREICVLGRTIRTTQYGVELEGDDKHVEKLEEEWEMSHCNPVGTPYVKPTSCTPAEEGEVEGTTPLGPVETTLFRRAAARINYTALDRPDLSFVSRIARPASASSIFM